MSATNHEEDHQNNFCMHESQTKDVKLSDAQNKILYHMMSEPVVMEFQQRWVEIATREQALPVMAGSSIDVPPLAQPPWLPQLPLPRQRLQEWVQGPVAEAKMASIKKVLGSFRQVEELRIAVAASSSSDATLPPPPDPLPPPVTEPEEVDEELKADYGATAEESSLQRIRKRAGDLR